MEAQHAGPRATILEIVTNYDGDTYRTVYTVRLETAVYVLHAFQKKSTRGIITPRRDMDLIRARLAQAVAMDAERVVRRGSGSGSGSGSGKEG